MKEAYHYPVMYREVLELLDVGKRKVVVDCTTGIGSHSYKLLEVMDKEGFLIGIDRDQHSLNVAKARLEPFKGRFSLVRDNFANLDKILSDLDIDKADVFLFDLGISTYQLSDSARGFSFLKEGPLDMRMDRDSFLSAYDLVNNLSEGELGNIFKKFGEERHSRRVARFLVEARKSKPISTTNQLRDLIIQAIPGKARGGRINPATRIFQALRIAVNRELESIEVALSCAISRLASGGRIGVISFHSLEDRIVKHFYRDYALKNILKIINKKPLTPTEKERGENSPSRSAKLRVAEKI
ncbi:MAG: 16S rRNA (cytosine(1402)-N(4))-methyltransferase RsmH [Candidatus Omnitrophica bacterium]|nr:16S rRNA (cytosine(1402)-N(4))-methyltransferase RsmH [Candidatus Omnitrophota bacterium]